MSTPVEAWPEPLVLRVWPSMWRIGVCLASGFLLWFFNYRPVIADPELLDAQRAGLLLELVVLVVACPVVLVRRRHPRLTLGIASVAALLSVAGFPLLWMAYTIIAERRQRLELYVATAVFMLVSVVNQVWIVDYIRDPEPLGGGIGYWFIIILLEAMVCVSLLAIGISRGNRRDLLESLRSGAELARREQSARVAQAQLTERARIAREMHDVLAHKISLISLHAGVLTYQDDLTPDERRQTARIIQEMSHQALEELREVLGVLRSDGVDANAKPQPSMLDLPSLIAEEEAAGTQVCLEVPADFWTRATTLGPNTTRHAHRIVQESLTNARKHARGRPVWVQVDGSESLGLDITVRNELSDMDSEVPGAGLGLAGLRERAQLAGGTLETTRTDTAFTIHARLPWNAKIGS